MADLSQFSEAQLTLASPDNAQAKVTVVLKFKNKLQELAQKVAIVFPKYTVINEGFCHAPCFRATVEIFGKRYTTTEVFKHRKEAEQEAARLALEDLGGGNIEEFFKKDPGQWTIEQAHSFLPKLAVSWKSIFHEFAIKEGADLPLPEYCTVFAGGCTTPYFVSDAKYKEVTYTGMIGKSKKDAEQLAAFVAIQSLLGDAKSAATLVPIIKSKAKHFSAMHGEDPASHTLFGINSIGASTRNPEKMADLPPVAQADLPPPIASHTLFGINSIGASARNPEKMADLPPVAQADLPPPVASHTLPGINSIGASTRNPEKLADLPPPVAQASSENVLPVPANQGFSLPIEFVPASGEQQAPTSSRKRRKNKRGARKRARSLAGMDANALAQAPSASQPMGVL